MNQRYNPCFECLNRNNKQYSTDCDNTCEEFGHPDPMDGSCHWCLEMCPYQWEMCHDEDWVRGLLSPIARKPAKSREEAIEFIENYKQGRIHDDVIDKL